MKFSLSNFCRLKGRKKINIAKGIIKYRKWIVILTMMITVICAGLQFFVPVNYNMADYLPKTAPSTIAVDVMEEEFGGEMPNTRVMIKDVSIQEALKYKTQLENIDGVSEVLWLDDVMDIKTPLETAHPENVETYYQDDHALYMISIVEGEEIEATNAIYDVIGEENAMEGEDLNNALQQEMAFSETMFAASLLVPIIIIILILSTTSWMEPVFFLTAIGVSVLINLGTNIFLGDVSFVTNSVSPILQLAVSLDYAIFLLHSFQDYRQTESNREMAMYKAIKRSFPAIVASASTTFFGFIALSFMNFEIGSDLGLNLVKGILLSFLSVMIFLPALVLMFYKWIDKTEHRPLIPNFGSIGKWVMKVRIPVLLLIAILIVPAFLAKDHTSFIYGIGEQPDSTRAGADIEKIENVFGQNTEMVILVPKGDLAKEELFVNELQEIKHVTSVVSFVSSVGTAIPIEYVEESDLEQFFSEKYSRIILSTNLEEEGTVAFNTVEKVKSVTASYYAQDTHILGESVTLYDIKNVVQDDTSLVNILTVATIAFVLLVTFKSLTIPIVLILTIQASVWINLSIPYFTETSLVYIGYLIVSTVQLAATVDYAILMTVEYLDNRKYAPAKEAVKKTLNEKVFAISISASILSSVGFILWITSTNSVVAAIGLLIGRGALLAFLLVVFLLPALLILLDKVIKKTTWKANFYEKE